MTPLAQAKQENYLQKKKKMKENIMIETIPHSPIM